MTSSLYCILCFFLIPLSVIPKVPGRLRLNLLSFQEVSCSLMKTGALAWTKTFFFFFCIHSHSWNWLTFRKQNQQQTLHKSLQKDYRQSQEHTRSQNFKAVVSDATVFQLCGSITYSLAFHQPSCLSVAIATFPTLQVNTLPYKANTRMLAPSKSLPCLVNVELSSGSPLSSRPSSCTCWEHSMIALWTFRFSQENDFMKRLYVNNAYIMTKNAFMHLFTTIYECECL